MMPIKQKAAKRLPADVARVWPVNIVRGSMLLKSSIGIIVDHCNRVMGKNPQDTAAFCASKRGIMDEGRKAKDKGRRTGDDDQAFITIHIDNAQWRRDTAMHFLETQLHRLVPALERPLKVAVTGHWSLGDTATVVFVTQAFVALLTRLKYAYPHGVVVLSGLALGADTIFAEAALALELPLDTCIANTAVLEKYAPGLECEQHLRLRACSRSLLELPFAERSAASYLALGRWLVDSCDLLIAAWNGEAPAKPGGTGDVVAMALATGRPVIHVDTVQHTVMLLQSP